MALCIDRLTSQNPEFIGLGSEILESQPWLNVFSEGGEVRQAVAASVFSEVWVVSCDDVEPINLAATIKSDSPGLCVCLISFDAGGSLRSRARTAEIDEVLEQGAFLCRYAAMKRRSLGMLDAPAPETVALHLPRASSAPATVPESTAMPEPAFMPTAVTSQLARLAKPRSVLGLSPGHAFVLTVVSGSGGAGKSAVSALSALIARKRGHRTLLLDCDLQFGDVADMVGTGDPLRIDMAMAHPEQLEREFARNGRLAVLAAPERLETAEEVVAGLPAFLEKLEDMFDVIVVNTGAVWAEQHAALLERSSEALFLIDQRVSSVRACKHALELCSRCGIATGPFRYALNRCAKGAPLTAADVSCALQGASVFELKDGGRDVEDYLSSGGAAELLELRGEFVKSLEHIMDQMLPAAVLSAERVSVEPDRRATRRWGRRSSRKHGRK